MKIRALKKLYHSLNWFNQKHCSFVCDSCFHTEMQTCLEGLKKQVGGALASTSKISFFPATSSCYSRQLVFSSASSRWAWKSFWCWWTRNCWTHLGALRSGFGLGSSVFLPSSVLLFALSCLLLHFPAIHQQVFLHIGMVLFKGLKGTFFCHWCLFGDRLWVSAKYLEKILLCKWYLI